MMGDPIKKLMQLNETQTYREGAFLRIFFPCFGCVKKDILIL